MVMALLNLINLRQSVRKYAALPVEPEKMERCLEAFRLAPSAHNAQPWKMVILDQEPLRTEVANATFSETVRFNRFTLTAPVIAVVLVDKPKLLVKVAMRLKKRDWQLIDIGIAVENFCLQAAEEGLGTCMIGWYSENKIKKTLNIPGDKSVGLLISIGYPEEGYLHRQKKRKEMNEIVSYNGI
jgi:nitroreductase